MGKFLLVSILLFDAVILFLDGREQRQREQRRRFWPDESELV